MSRILVLSALTALLFAPSAFAHHPFAAEFDLNKPVTITGTVTVFEWMNPHSGIHVEGRDAKGVTGEWIIELGGSGDLTRSGWTKASLKPGDKITVEGWMARDGSKHVNAKQVKMPAGKTLMAASSHDAPDGGGAAGTSGEHPPASKPQR
jgi:hypothetical protein